jgi:hydroxysqualene synthase
MSACGTVSAAATAPVEMPSGKDAGYENFPIGSFLLPAAVRPAVAGFYAFARAIDDIADAPDLAPEEKLRRLDGFERALGRSGDDDPAYAKAHAMRRTLAERGITDRHCLDLIAAFKQDAVKNRYRDWDDLMGYCDKSAAPVGRFLLDLHGGGSGGYGASDALCNALQVINHLQDCQDDFRRLDRVYLPTAWLEEEGATVADLDRPRATPALRRVLDRALDGTDALLATAASLPSGLVSRRLALESGAIVQIAHALSWRLRRRDPLAGRVALGRAGYAWACVRGATKAAVGIGE